MLNGYQVDMRGMHSPQESLAADHVIPFGKKSRTRTIAVKKQPLALRLLDIVGASAGLLLSLPLILVAMAMIWLQDRHNPFYVAERIGAGGRKFRFIKLRSIPHRSGVRPDEIITSRDPRVTRLGHWIRASKVDELPQFWHVLRGEMSLVGPRANVQTIVDAFTEEELRIISVKPGITDLASIVFMNLGKVLEASENPKLDYNQLVRPWKSRLALIYVDNQSVGLALRIIMLTVVAFFNHQRALEGVARIAMRYKSDPKLARIVRREEQLTPCAPPGATAVVVEVPQSAAAAVAVTAANSGAANSVATEVSATA